MAKYMRLKLQWGESIGQGFPSPRALAGIAPGGELNW
jgi:hypothetical protein